MKLSYYDLLGDQKRHVVSASVTTEHAASSYGQPVIVLESDGGALDLTSWLLLNYQIEEATAEEFELLKKVLILDQKILNSYFGRKGGMQTSDDKARTAAENGKKGGRPRKLG